MVLSVGSGNQIVFAFAAQQSLASVCNQLNKVARNETLNRLAREAARWMAETDPPDGTPIFTDDHAPFEEITRRMLTAVRP